MYQSDLNLCLFGYWMHVISRDICHLPEMDENITFGELILHFAFVRIKGVRVKVFIVLSLCLFSQTTVFVMRFHVRDL